MSERIKSKSDPLSFGFDADQIIEKYYIKCEAPDCELMDKEFNLCLCVTGKCYMEENNRNFRGEDTRVILQADDHSKDDIFFKEDVL